MKQVANGARAGQLARQRGYGDIDIKKQVFVYIKAGFSQQILFGGEGHKLVLLYFYKDV
jgi:hypothetical protein